MAYIEIKSLTYSYPLEKKKSLKSINLSINQGDVLLVMGKSGSGKSTLAKCLSGAAPHFYGGTIEGSIILNGNLIDKMERSERAQEITMVFQDPEKQLIMNKVHREIAFGLENVGVDENKIKRRVFESMQFANILDLAYRDIKTLSGGEKQKVAITSAIAYLPKCIILDEPTSQLDPAAAEEVVCLVKKINEELGITVIIIEQRANKWFDVVDKIAFMKEGSMSFYKDKKDFYMNATGDRVNFLPDYLRLINALGIKEIPENLKQARSLLNGMDFKNLKQVQEKNSSKIIEIKGLNCSYEGVKAVKDVSLTLAKGDFLGVMGSNGAGKSTLIKAIMGLKEYEGSIRIKDYEVKDKSLKFLAKTIGYVSQNPSDYISKRTVYEELKFTLDNHDIKDSTRIIESTLESLDIGDLKDKNPRDLSGGQKQRVAIASIVVLNPEILLLDEPTRGLDLELKNRLGKTLENFRQKGTTIIIITHDVDFTSNFCNKFALMFSGEVVSKGNREDVLSDGIYYSSTVNKLLRNKNSKIFTIKQAVDSKMGLGEKL